VTVSAVNLRLEHESIRNELEAAVHRVLSSGVYILGSSVDEFEAKWAAYVGAKHCIAVGNGLDALRLSLTAAGVGPGGEVIVPSNTYIATWLAVTLSGATPVPVEPDPATYNLDPERLASALSKRTQAILPVHLYGQPADMSAIMGFANREGLPVIEDAAQAHGAVIDGLRIGCIGLATAWSFYPTKNLGALGDAGAVTTDDESVAETVRCLRNYGQTARYTNAVIGINSRMDELQAACLIVKLAHLEDRNQRRREVAARYSELLHGMPFVLPSVLERTVPVWHQYVIRSADRAGLLRHLNDEGVEALVHYPTPPHLQPAYLHVGLHAGDLPISEALHREVVSLPIHPFLSDDEVEQVASALDRFTPVIATDLEDNRARTNHELRN
jgi:dTDP-4-amino-4,6-dideoxygalactose transaminase